MAIFAQEKGAFTTDSDLRLQRVFMRHPRESFGDILLTLPWWSKRFFCCVVHEVAHTFHNCKRSTLGLPQSRSTEWLPNIAFTMRETFAYACEAYNRMREQARGPAQRSALLTQFAAGPSSSDERLDHDELIDVLSEAIAARNGWKRILARCSVP